MRWAAGKRFGRYTIRSLLGSGGMGEIYLAWDAQLDRNVALKILPADVAGDPARIQRFVQEAKAASALNHPNIAHVYEIGEADDSCFIAMEYIEGQTLAARIAGRPLGITEILEIGIQVADALEEARTKGVTHRDIKPWNLIITPRNQVKVVDFGLAKIVRPAELTVANDVTTQLNTNAGVVMGTVQYMSPEQALGHEVDHRTDIFSLGVVLYEMATGRGPFSGTTASEIIDRIVHESPEAIARWNYSVPMDLDRIVRKCLEKDREQRYQSARELLAALQSVRQETPVGNRTPPRPRRSRSRKTIDSLAVLPLLNASSDPGTEYLSDGMTESIINSLAQLPQLRVLARATVFRYKTREIDPRRIGHELGIHAVLMGRVLQLAEKLVISVELVDTSDGSQIWGAQYSRAPSDIFAVQEEVTGEVIRELRLTLSGDAKKRLAKQHTHNPEAYQLYLKGRHAWNKATRDGMQRGIRYYQRAIEVDTSYALAYAGLADCYSVLSHLSTSSPRDLLPKAKWAAAKALEIDESLPEAHTALGYARAIYDWDWGGAEREFKRGIELKSSDEWSHEAYGWYLAAAGRFDESLEEMRRAQIIDPLNPSASSGIGIPLYYAGRYDEAIECFRTVSETDPDFAQARFRLGLAYVQTGRHTEAIEELQRASELSGDRDVVAAIGYVHAVAGASDKARDAIAELAGRAQREYVPGYDVAIIHVGLGQTEQAFEWLERAYEERSYWVTFLRVDPLLSGLRRDGRFLNLLRQISPETQ